LQRVTLVVLSTFTGAVLLHSPWWIFPPTQPTARLHPLAAYRPATSLHLYLRPVFLLFVSFICRCVPEKTTRGLRVSFLLFNSFSRFIHYWNQRVSLEVKSRPYSRGNQCERKLLFSSALVQIEFRLPLFCLKKRPPFNFLLLLVEKLSFSLTSLTVDYANCNWGDVEKGGDENGNYSPPPDQLMTTFPIVFPMWCNKKPRVEIRERESRVVLCVIISEEWAPREKERERERSGGTFSPGVIG
jgi:hypothetical protein